MRRELGYKSDFGKSVDRFSAFWRHEVLDRPPLSLGARRVAEPTTKVAPKTFSCHRDRWFDVEYHVDSATAGLEGLEWFGDSYPSFWPNMGPEIAATPLGVEIEFGDWTNWSIPNVKTPADWQKIIDAPLNFDNIYWRKMEQMADYAVQVSRGRFVVGMTDLHGNYDILAALRDPQHLCMDLLDCPELLERAAAKAVACFAECFRRCWARSEKAGYGSTTWCALYSDRAMYIPSCDFWCMTSPEMTRKHIWPFVEAEIKLTPDSHFHLDGPNALQHLDLLLECPELTSVQWVYGAGNGPVGRWKDVYQRIHDAGKGMEIGCESPQQAMEFLEAFRPELLWLHVPGLNEPAAAAAFLKDVEKLVARKKAAGKR